MIATPRPWVWLSLLVLAVAVPAVAHDDGTPHQLVLTSFAVEDDSLRVVLWVERPTSVVAEAFRERFADQRDDAAAQDEAFRPEQWATLAASLTVQTEGESLGVELRPLSLVNNGRGNDVRFVYGVGATVPVGNRDRVAIDYDNQALLGEDHVFLSVYAESDDDWRVVEDSNRDVRGTRGRGPTPGATWSHDPRLRQGRVVFERK